ncbi:MAG: GNAT family N-acetyltransferase [Deltaproteobacteria bacterium]|nr:GNAT family N-acetyltransferase [Deltaproteobacteria bacterium]
MNEWKIKRINADVHTWKKLIAGHPHLTFHKPLWARVTQDGLGSENCCLIFEKNGKVMGGMLGFVKQVLWAKFLYFNLPYGGVIGETPDGAEFDRLLCAFALEEHITRIRIVDSPLLPPTPEGGFHLIRTQTHILGIKGKTSDRILSDFHPGIRRNIKKAVKSGIVVEAAEKRQDANAFYALYLESMQRNEAVPKYGRSFVDAVFEHIIKAGQGTLLLAKMKEKPIAGVLLVDSENMTHYLMGGSRTSCLRYRPNDLLFFEAIKRAANGGSDYFDFLPSGVNDHNLMRFKTKWGAAPYPVHTLERIVQPTRMKFWDCAYRLGQTKAARRLIQRYRNRK